MTLTRLEFVPSRAEAGCATLLSDAPDLKHFTFAIIQNESGTISANHCVGCYFRDLELHAAMSFVPDHGLSESSRI